MGSSCFLAGGKEGGGAQCSVGDLLLETENGTLAGGRACIVEVAIDSFCTQYSLSKFSSFSYGG